MDRKLSDYLYRQYFDENRGGAFANPITFYKSLPVEKRKRINMEQLKSWLLDQETYAIHRPSRKNFPRPRVVVPYKRYQLDADSASLAKYKDSNNGYGWFILCVNIMTRYVWTCPMKTPNAEDAYKCLKKILQPHVITEHIRSDHGTEFTNTKVQQLFRDLNMNSFFSHNETKANYAEAAIKTLKTLLTKYMSHNQTHKWVDVLPSITRTYNHTYHRSIGMTPTEASRTSDLELWNILYQPKSSNKKVRDSTQKPLFKVNDVVRLSTMRKTFGKTYDQHFTRELFVVSDSSFKEYIPVYRLKDFDNDPIDGIFYNQELLPGPSDLEKKTYLIESIVDRRKAKGIEEVLVKWLQWPSKFNTWIRKSSLKGHKYIDT